MAEKNIKAARLKAEEEIYKLMDKLEGKKNGFNSESYKLYFQSMDDKTFIKFMKRLANEEWFNLFFEIDLADFNKDTPTLDRITKVADQYKIPLEEYVAYPFKNKYNLNEPPVSQ